MSIFTRRKTEETDPSALRVRRLTLLTENGTAALFWMLFTVWIVPFLFRASFFAIRASGLSPHLQGSFTILTAVLASLFLGTAILRALNRSFSSDDALYAAIRLSLFGAPALYLELLLFRFCFSSESFLPKNVFSLALALLTAYACSHTILWLTSILNEHGAILPSASLWGQTWILHFRNPLSTIGRFFLILLSLWVGIVLFPLLSRGPLVFLYRSIPGSVLLAIVYSCVLATLLRPVLRLSARIVLRTFSHDLDGSSAAMEPGASEFQYDAEIAARYNARNNPSSAEELLVEQGLLTRQDAYSKPAAYLTDSDIPVSKPLLPAKWTIFDIVPLLLIALLLSFLAISSLLTRTTAAGAVDSIVHETRLAASAAQRAGDTATGSQTYMNGLGDLEAFDAYLNAIAGGVDNERLNEESAELETYSGLFKTAESYSDTTSLPYLLEAKLLMKDGRPKLAAEVLAYMIDIECDTDETYLLLLESLRDAGEKDSALYRQARRVCISRRYFTDNLSYLDSLTARDATLISASMQSAKTEFYRSGQLLLWLSYLENGEIETAYNGLYALLSDERFSKDLDVLRAFVSAGSKFHLRFDGTRDGISSYYAVTAEKALLYDSLYTVARAAGEATDYTLVEIKQFVASALVACEQYKTACTYLAEAFSRYAENDELVALYRAAYGGLSDEEKRDVPSYEALMFSLTGGNG